MVKDILNNLVVIIFCVIFSVSGGILTIPGLVDEINKEISGENRRECIEILDKKTERIEDKGLTLEELTNEDVNHNLSKSEIGGYDVFNFNKGRYKVSIYFDSEENIISIQKDYPEGYDVVYVINIVSVLIVYPGIFWIGALLIILVCLFDIYDIIVENKEMEKYGKERKQDIKE